MKTTIYNRRWRAKNIAKGLTGKGYPRVIPLSANRYVEAGKIGGRVTRIKRG